MPSVLHERIPIEIDVDDLVTIAERADQLGLTSWYLAQVLNLTLRELKLLTTGHHRLTVEQSWRLADVLLCDWMRLYWGQVRVTVLRMVEHDLTDSLPYFMATVMVDLIEHTNEPQKVQKEMLSEFLVNAGFTLEDLEASMDAKYP